MGRPRNTSKTKHCPKCKKTKSRKFFYTTSAYCKKCQCEKVKDNQKAKADYYNEYRLEYSQRNPRKRTAWKEAFIKNWEDKHQINYGEYVSLQSKIRNTEKKLAIATDPEKKKKYRLKIKTARKQFKELKKKMK